MKTKWTPAPQAWEKLKAHPLSRWAEYGAGIDIKALAAHMRRFGYDQDEGIVLFDGKILDGRHRHAAAIDAEITPPFRQFLGSEADAKAYVCKKLLRQHLDTSQRAMLAGELLRILPGVGIVNTGEELATNQVDAGSNEPASTNQVENSKSQEEAAKAMNVSPSAVKRASAVIRSGTSELCDAVKDGTISVSDAAKVSAEEPTVQNAAVDAVRNGHASSATGAAKAMTGKGGKKGSKARDEKKNGEKENPSEPQIQRDENGREVPAHLAGDFTDREVFARILNALTGITKELNHLKERPSGQLIRFQEVEIDLKNVRRKLRYAQPYAVCGMCKAEKKKCNEKCACKGRGWLDELAYGNLPGEYK